MSREVIVLGCGPSVSIQDLGRTGFLAFGVSRGGAADRTAMLEGATLLGQNPGLAAFEMAGYGGEFEVTEDTRIALTGAPMVAKIDGQTLVWNAVHFVLAGQRVSIGAALSGVYGYVHFGGGVESAMHLNSRSTHITAGIGGSIIPRDRIEIGTDANAGMGAMKLPIAERFQGGVLRIVPSVQTDMFSIEERVRFEATDFIRSARGNRQGVQLDFDGAPFSANDQLSLLSEIILPGDIQMTGEGVPFILLPECQTTGGYPRIGTIIPQDLAKAAQTAAGEKIRFRFVSVDQAVADLRSDEDLMAEIRGKLHPLVREPSDIRDLLGYQLISGMIAGNEE